MSDIPRVHHLYVATAKHIFMHAKHGIVKVLDPISLADAQRYQLSPILLYGITVAGLPIRWLSFTSSDAPLSIKEFLANAWRLGKGLRGLPDIVVVNKYLYGACPSLADALKQQGVKLQVTSPSDKSHPASLRSAQTSAKDMLRSAGSPPTQPHESALDAFNRLAQEDHDAHLRIGPLCCSGQNGVAFMQWQQLPMRPLITSLDVHGLGWKQGSWLSTWSRAVPPAGARYFKLDRFEDMMLLMSGIDPEEFNEDVDYGIDDLSYNTQQLIKMLLANWPCRPSLVAKQCDITLKTLNGYLANAAPLPPESLLELKRVLGIGIDYEYMRQTILGPYMLMANNAKALDEFYDEYSDGGDAAPVELISDAGNADPSYRYVVIHPCGGEITLLMIPRGSTIAECLPDILFNYRGLCRVHQGFYRDVVKTCAEIALNPIDNVGIMASFVSRNARYFDDMG